MPGPIDALMEILTSGPIQRGRVGLPVAPVTGDLGQIAMDSDQMESETGATGFWDFAPGTRPGAEQRRQFGQIPDDIELSGPIQGLKSYRPLQRTR